MTEKTQENDNSIQKGVLLMTFGKNLKRIRETIGLSQAELAKKSKLTNAAISHFETGRRDPSLKNIIKLCKGLGCSPNVLIEIK